MYPLKRITDRIFRVGDPNDENSPIPLLEVDEFFEGNNIEGSIGCNLASAPTPKQFYELFRKTSGFESVHKVLVQITAFDDPDWPFSDTVWIITSSALDQVKSWFPEELCPDEVWEGWIKDCSYEPVDIPNGMQPIACWWD